MIRRFFRRSKPGWLRTGSIRSCSHLRTCGVADVHVLDADRPAVRLPQDRDQSRSVAYGGSVRLVVKRPGPGRPRSGRTPPDQAARVTGAGRVEPERVEVGQVMADLAVGVDQPGDRSLRPRRVLIEVRARQPVAPLAELVALEEDPPGLVDRSGIVGTTAGGSPPEGRDSTVSSPSNDSLEMIPLGTGLPARPMSRIQGERVGRVRHGASLHA